VRALPGSQQCHRQAAEEGALPPASAPSAARPYAHSLGTQLLDYDAARSKSKKLGEKANADPITLRAVRRALCPLSPSRADPRVLPRQAETEEEQAREIFQALDGHLREELPQLLDLRVPYLEPSFECMVRLFCCPLS